MRRASGYVAAAALLVVEATSAFAAEQAILGTRLLMRDPHGSEARRSLTLVAREKATDVPAIVGDPVGGGATLMVGLNGGSSGQFFELDANGWSATANGFRFDGPIGSGDPVRRVVLRRTPGGTAALEIVLKGSLGTQPLVLVPPDPGSDATAVLTLNNGDAYCVSFGGAAGGRVMANTDRQWRVADATAEPGCPRFCCAFAGNCAWSGALEVAFCPELAGTLGFPGAVCDATTGGCRPPPGGTGNCCELFGGDLCFAGPTVQQPPCDEAGGSFSSAAVCDPTEGCVVP